MNRNIQGVRIAVVIDPDLFRRREQFADQPSARRVWSEVACVTTSNGRARDTFIEHVANSRGADIALQLPLRAQSIHDQVTQTLMMNETQATLH